MDFDAVADELYGLRPDEFTRARNERSQEARSQGERDLATEIGRLRKPTAGAWVVNLLVRAERDEIEQLLELGRQLRQAQGELRGEELRVLTQRRSQVVSALASQGRRWAAETGHPVSESVGREVEGTLEAALADPDAAASVRSGRLTTSLSYSGLGPVGAVRRGGGAAAKRERRAPADRAGTGRAGTERDEQAGEVDRAEVERVERSLSDAQEAARRAEEERGQARDDELDVRSRQEAADERITQLERELEQARDAAMAAARELEEASSRREAADREVTAAHRRVERERRGLERLRGA